MRKIAWPDNLHVQLQLGTAFWLLLAVGLILVFVWRKIGTERLGEIVVASFSPSATERYIKARRN